MTELNLTTAKRNCDGQPSLAPATGSASSDREIMVAEIDAAAAAIAGCYEELSPSSKAQTVKLAHALAGLRQRMVTPNDGIEPSAGAKAHSKP